MIERDGEGYLVEPTTWTVEIARDLAQEEGVVLTEEHWAVLHFMRNYLDQRQIAPDARHVMKYLKETRGASRNRLFELFPYGYVKQACKIAGMRRPRAWSTG